MPKQRNRASSSTPGKAKGINCQKSVAKNFYSKDTKAHKKSSVLYLQACREVSQINGIKVQELVEIK